MAEMIDVNVVPQFDQNAFQPQNVGMPTLDRKYDGDKRLMVQFFKNPVFNEFQSNQEGREIWMEIDYIRIITPGSRDVLTTEVTDQYKRRFPTQWEAYQKKNSQHFTGTPLEMVPWLNRAQVQELKYFNLHTVENVVEASDTVAQKFPGFHQLKARAKTFLDAAANEAEKTKLEGMLKERDSKVIELTQAVASLTARLDQMLAKEKGAK